MKRSTQVYALLLAALAWWHGGAVAAPRIERDIPYAFAKGRGASLARQSFDLYLPDAARPPLVVFIHGGFWVESDDEYKIGARLAQTLVADGIAVALVRYRLSPGVRHPAHVRDVAAALAALKRLAGQYGYDTKRLYLIGHSAGATLATLLALDPTYLGDVGMQPGDLAGAVLVSGIYDLGPNGPMATQYAPFAKAAFGNNAAERRAASPLTHVRAGPPLLVLAAANDLSGFALDTRRFVQALRRAGHTKVSEALIPQQDHFGIIDVARTRFVRALIADFVGAGTLDPQTRELMELRQRWHDPPFSTQPFWRSPVPVQTFPVDARLRAALREIYEANAYELSAYPLARYHAIDLAAFLKTLPKHKVGVGDYLIVTNVRGERTYLRRRDIEAHRPLLVIGLDDERNLFRLNVFYRNRLEYSWMPQRPPVMARPVGAFIYFREAPPAALQPTTRAHFGLTADSFRLVATDPFAAVADLPASVQNVLTTTNACLACHSFRGAGARAGHITGAGGKLHGGFALALEDYPAAAWERFIFDQPASARLIGVRPNPVAGPAAQQLYDLVVTERASSRR